MSQQSRIRKKAAKASPSTPLLAGRETRKRDRPADDQTDPIETTAMTRHNFSRLRVGSVTNSGGSTEASHEPAGGPIRARGGQRCGQGDANAGTPASVPEWVLGSAGNRPQDAELAKPTSRPSNPPVHGSKVRPQSGRRAGPHGRPSSRVRAGHRGPRFNIGRESASRAARYAPGTRAGRHLLAHEITHVIQQSLHPERGNGPAISRASGHEYSGSAAQVHPWVHRNKSSRSFWTQRTIF